MNPACLPQDFNGKVWRLAEECAEVIKACSKMQRHGPIAEFEGMRYDNVDDLVKEIQDMADAWNRVTADLN
jgi:NTP pyrophosphatase (non-canonical NTP hydrolase)